MIQNPILKQRKSWSNSNLTPSSSCVFWLSLSPFSSSFSLTSSSETAILILNLNHSRMRKNKSWTLQRLLASFSFAFFCKKKIKQKIVLRKRDKKIIIKPYQLTIKPYQLTIKPYQLTIKPYQLTIKPYQLTRVL